MKNAKPTLPDARALRQQAEQKLREHQALAKQPPKETDARALVHELEVHQIELEMQNEELRRAEAQAQEAADKYTDLFDFAPLGYFQLTQDGVIREANLAGAALLGLDRSRVVSRRFGPSVTPACLQTFATFCKAVLASDTKQTCEIQLLCQARGARDVQLEGLAVPDQAGLANTWRLAVLDITPRKQGEEAVSRSQKTFSELVERAPFGIYVVDSQFRIAQMNAGSQTGAFRNVRPVIGRPFNEAMRILWPEPVAAEIIAHFRHTLETGEPFYSPRFVNPRHDVETVEAYEWELHRLTLPDGQYGVICYYFDSTKLRTAEQALRESEQRLKHAQQIANVGSWEWDIQTGALWWSDQVYRQMGEQPGQFTPSNDSFPRRLHPEDRAVFEAAVQRALAGAAPYDGEFRIVRPDGTVRVLHSRGEVVPGPDGQPRIMVGVCLDITERKQAEQALQDNVRLFNDIIDGCGPSAIFLKDRDGKFITINAPLEKMLGMSRDELKGKTDYDLFPKEVADLYRTHDTKVMATGEAIQVEESADLPDGHHFFLANKFPLVDAAGRLYGVGAISHDITERKRVEEALRESRAKLKAAFASMTEAIFIADAEGRLIDFNEGFVRYHRFKDREECSRTIADCPRYLDAYFQDGTPAPPQMWAMARALRGETASDVEYMLRRKDTGETWWGSYNFAPIKDEGGRILGAVVAGREITDRKQAEEALRKRAEEALRMSEEEFRSLAEAMPQIVWATRPDGWNIYFNQQWVDYTGMTMEESYGHGWNTPFHPDDKQRAWEAWQRATQHNERYSLECRLRRADGVYRWWLIRGEPMRGANGEILKWFGTCTDIEDIKRAEAALQEANDLLEKRVAERTAELQQANQLLRKSEERHRLLAETMLQGVVHHDADGKVIAMNPAAERILGKCREEFLGSTSVQEERHTIRENGQRFPGHEHPAMVALRTGQEVHGVIMGVFNRKVGDHRWISIGAVPLCRPGETRPSEVYAVFEDITERKQAEAEIRRRAEELRARNEELNQFNQAMVGRELRMIELKKEIDALCAQFGQPLRYGYEPESTI
jgi:PAS domain S-box-containing protein